MDNLFLKVSLNSILCNKIPYNKGIYEIHNLNTRSSYIGSSYTSLLWRIKNHLCLLKADKHTNARLQQDWNSYGSGAFEFRLLESLTDKLLILNSEKKWIIKRWHEMPFLYNRYIPKESGYLPPNIGSVSDSSRSSKINSDVARNIFTDYHVNNLCVEAIAEKYKTSKQLTVNVIRRRSWVHATRRVLVKTEQQNG